MDANSVGDGIYGDKWHLWAVRARRHNGRNANPVR
jgi:hypothetical protein